MRFIIEFDGPVADIAACWHRAHRDAAAAVGWSALDAITFRRLTRTKGREADYLRGAKPLKLEEYHKRFAEFVETHAVVAECRLHADVRASLDRLNREGACVLVTLGSNTAARWAKLDEACATHVFIERLPLNNDPRRRSAELRVLAENDPRAVVVASTDALIRSADAAELFAVGGSSGCCTPARLHQAGARAVFSTLGEFADVTRAGAPELVELGLPPEPLT